MDLLFRLAFGLCCLLLVLAHLEAAAHDDDNDYEIMVVDEAHYWQGCNTFMAPSLSASMGWGVFAGRSFQEGEIVDMASLILPMPKASPQVQHSALDDYVYGYHRIHFTPEIRLEEMDGVFLGMSMFFNHHPTEPNLEYTAFGREPALDVSYASNAVGFRAKRFIRAGEELFSHYGNKGSNEWFNVRRIPLQHPDTGKTSPLGKDVIDFYCSKMHSGIGRPTWKGRILPMLPPKEVVGFHMKPSYLPPWDAGYQEAKAKVDVSRGDRIEISVGLVMSQKLLKGSILEPIAIAYQHFSSENQSRLSELRQRGQLQLQYQGRDTDWNRIDLLAAGSNYLGDVAIFPAAGNIGMVRRVAVSKAAAAETVNCQLLIGQEEDGGNDSAGVLLELVATKDIAVGEILVMGLEDFKIGKAHEQLLDAIRLTGMPLADLKVEQNEGTMDPEL